MSDQQNAGRKYSQPAGRNFETSIEIDAPPEIVWKALTDAAELARWFPLEARVKPGVGGSVWISWGAECQGEAPITAWDPPHHFQWTETMPSPADPSKSVPILIDYKLEGRGGKTILRFVHSGMGNEDAWDGYLDSITRGWKFELRGLRNYVTHHLGRDRRVLWVRQPCKLAVEDVARRVIGEEGRVLRGKLAGLREGDPYRLERVAVGGHLEGVIQVNSLPRSLAATVTNLNDSYLRFEIEDYAGGKEAWLWLSTYGLESNQIAEIETQWKSALTAALA